MYPVSRGVFLTLTPPPTSDSSSVSVPPLPLVSSTSPFGGASGGAIQVPSLPLGSAFGSPSSSAPAPAAPLPLGGSGLVSSSRPISSTIPLSSISSAVPPPPGFSDSSLPPSASPFHAVYACASVWGCLMPILIWLANVFWLGGYFGAGAVGQFDVVVLLVVSAATPPYF